ncbi:solute carrier family 35 member F6-like [Centruroides vittatus]|uniref:solute carrier family 35 member F6-like n=1 Tax=Centruroides vittatus TaxID=120091 RepID=UPI003510A45A
MALTLKQLLLCIGMLITGSINTLSKKAQNDCSAAGYPDSKTNSTTTVHKFDHPWFQTVIMFIGEMSCLIGLYYLRWKERKTRIQEYHNRLMVTPGSSLPSAKAVVINQEHVFHWIFAIPTFLDLIGTSVAGIGLLYVDASIWQMLRGSLVIFTGLLSKIFLKKNLKGLQWLGMTTTVIGLILVGLSGVLKHSAHPNHKIVLGIILIIVGQVFSAIQMIVEEIFLKSRNFHPLQVVGMEGFYGFIITSLVVLPILYFIPGNQVGGVYENSIDALYQIGNNMELLIFSLLYLISIAFYNYFGLSVTKNLTAVHRTLIDACRTIVIWICGLIIYYFFDKSFGEPFDKRYGIFQVDGFLFLIMGTAFYNEIIDFPFIPQLRKTPVESYPSLVDSGITSVRGVNHNDDESAPLLDDSYSSIQND